MEVHNGLSWLSTGYVLNRALDAVDPLAVANFFMNYMSKYK